MPYYLAYLSNIQASYKGFIFLWEFHLKYWNMARYNVPESRWKGKKMYGSDLLEKYCQAGQQNSR